MPLTLPYQITAGQKLLSKPVRDNFQAIADKFTGGIVDADCSTTMNLQGTKLLDASVPGTKLADLAVTTAKLATGAVAAAQLAASAVLGTNIGTLIGTGKLAITIHKVTYSFSVGAQAIGSQAANPTVNFAVATYDLVGAYIEQTGGNIGLPLVVTDPAGTNWAGLIRVYNASSSTAFTMQGKVVYVFVAKATA